MPHSLLLGTTGSRSVILDTPESYAAHRHVVGTTGSGKTRLLTSFFLQLLHAPVPVALLDLSGDMSRHLLGLLLQTGFFQKREALDRLWYIQFNRADRVIPFNILKSPYDPHITSQNILEAIKRVFPSSNATPLMDMVFLASILTLIENHLPFPAIDELLSNAKLRSDLVKHVTDPKVQNLFNFRLDGNASTDSVLRRSFDLIFPPVIERSLNQSENRLNFQEIINNGISCIVNLGGLDEYSQKFLGSLIMVGFEQAFLSRSSIPEEEKRLPYHLIVDEFPMFSSNSEISFSRMLELVRKYKGTLYLAHQTVSQLSTKIAGSLQNAITILLRLGLDDSTWASQRFYRQQPPLSWIEKNIMQPFKGKEDNPFQNIETASDAKAVFENLKTGQAIVRIGETIRRVQTPFIPDTTAPIQQIQAIEDIYADLLAVPVTSPRFAPPATGAAALSPLAKRRVVVAAPATKQPLETFVGAAGFEDDLLQILSTYYYMTSLQIAQVLQKVSSKTNIHKKLNTLVSNGLAEKVTIATKSGKPPDIFTLSVKGMKYLNAQKGLQLAIPTGTRKHGYIEHTLAVNTILINAALLPSYNASFTLVEFFHERSIKNTPWKVPGGLLVPDGYVSFVLSGAPFGTKNEQVTLACECDRNSEEKEKIQRKIQAYCSYAAQVSQSLTVAFVVVSGGQSRALQLRSWCEEYVQDKKDFAELFLFGAPPVDCPPVELFTGNVFIAPFDTAPHALIEKMP